MGKFADLALASLPTFKCLIPSKGKTVTMRSFVVKEQKLLLIAKQSETDQLDNIINATNQVIQNCIVDGDVVVSKLPSYDIEYMFIQLWMHSTGTTKSKVFYRCLNPIKDDQGNPTEEVCGQTNGVVVELKDAKVATDEIKTGIIEVNSDGISKLVFEYPSFSQITRHDLAIAEENIDETFRIYGECLKYVYKADGIQMVHGEDFQSEDAIELMEMLQQSIFDQIISFFVNTPSVSATTGFTCRKCGHKTDIGLRGLQDFF